MLSPEARDYLNLIRTFNLWIPQATNHTVMLYECRFPNNRRRDAGNCMKILKDALFQEDKNVLGWELPPRRGVQKNKLNYEGGEVAVWLVEVPDGSK